MSLKNKTIVVLLIIFATLLIIPNVVKAATQTYVDEEQGIEWSYQLDASENVVNLKCNTISIIGKVIIPSEIDGKTVISLADDNYKTGAFEGCSGITEIIIPNTITTIGRAAFENCSGLSTVTIPNSVTQIGSHAFYGCEGLKSVTLSNNLLLIDSYAFGKCSSLKTLIIPDSVTAIEDGAFSNCSELTNITLSQHLAKLNCGVFNDCDGLISIIIPESVTTIEGTGFAVDKGAFNDCDNLEKVLIPDTVVTIQEYAFYGCDKLTIYGNDGQESKIYAEENEINFKNISEWNDSNIGDDITSPTVEDLTVTYSTDFDYDSGTGYYYVSTGTTISITAEFSETIYGDSVPTLIIKCGNGDNIELTNGIITGEYIVYTYTIAEQNQGIVTAVELSGGDVADEAGNLAELSCPELTVNLGEGLVYANGSGVDANPGDDNGENQNPEEEPGKGNQGTDDEGEGITDPDDKADDTTAPESLPNTGKFTLISILAAVAIAGTISFIKTKKYREI